MNGEQIQQQQQVLLKQNLVDMSSLESVAKFQDMKSIQTYSTKNEYLYAMKEDLAEWFNCMYENCNLNVYNFIDQLENGVIICEHANNVMRAVYNAESHVPQQDRFYVHYKLDARAQSFQARDNISNFINWCRKCVKVRECLMFETDDLILKKNEKNFILCLLEIARYGSKYGIQVPTLIRLEQEIDDEIKQEKLMKTTKENANNELLILTPESSEELNDSLDNNFQSYEDYELDEGENTATNTSTNDSQTSPTPPSDLIPSKINEKQSNLSPSMSLILSSSSTSSCSSSYSSSEQTSSSSAVVTVSSLSSSVSLNENLYQTVTIQQQQQRSITKIPQTEPPNKQTLIPSPPRTLNKNTPKVVRNLNEQFKQSSSSSNNERTSLSIAPCLKMKQKIQANKNDLHTHVNSLANRCTCIKKFPVIKIGEGKYRIGNTTNIVFIRILRSHIMVRVGGGWDTLENYLNKHDPCRYYVDHHHHQQQANSSINGTSICCSSEESNSFSSIGTKEQGSILLTPVTSNKQDQVSQSQQQHQSSNLINRFIQNNVKLQVLSNTNDDSFDFTDAKLIIKRDTKGKHSIGKILLSTDELSKDQCNNMNIIGKKSNKNSSKSSQNTSLNSTPSTSSLSLNAGTTSGLAKSESLLKTRVKRLINKIPTPTGSNYSSPQATRDDQIEQLLKNTPVYTETNLPPRLLRKYEKLRHSNANSETSSVASGDNQDTHSQKTTGDYDQNDLVDLAKTIQDIYKIDDIIDLTPTSLNDDTSSQSPKSRLNTTSSPKAPPRTKNRYRKSKTTDLKKHITIDDGDSSPPPPSIQTQELFTTPRKSPEFEDSLESGNDDEELNEIKRKNSKKEDQKYTFSLNYLTNDQSKYLKYIPLDKPVDKQDSFEDDSLIFNKNQTQNSNILGYAIEGTQSQTNFTRQYSRRAKWDKSQQKLELPFYQTSDDHLCDDSTNNNLINKQLIQPIRRDFSVPAFSTATPAKVKPVAAVKATPKPIPSKETPQVKTQSGTLRKQQQLDVAKQRLYEMKRSLDAKNEIKQKTTIPKSSTQIIVSNSTVTRTTPRKVKKRNGERSQTEAIVNDEKPIITKKLPSRAPTPTKSSATVRSSSAHSVTRAHHINDDSLHTSRQRHDSLTSNASSSTNTAFSSVGLSNEYKENKAYELRKIANLKNRIEVKKMDPIYTRSHPICTEIVENTSELTRKRLFVKKDEANMSFVNSTIPSAVSTEYNSVERDALEIQITQRPVNTTITTTTTTPTVSNTTKLKKSPTSIQVPNSQTTPIKSKSSCDLFYSLKRTNSEQDLLDLMSNCEAPKGDLEQYKIMKSECEKLEKLILKQKAAAATKKPPASVTPTKPRQLKAKYKRSQTQNLADDIDKMQRQQSTSNLTQTRKSQSEESLKQKRSSSLPSYVRVPLIKIVDYDEEMESKNVQ